MGKILLLLFLLSIDSVVSAQSFIKTMALLPDTGQNMSYTTTFGEDNDYTINPPFFINHQNGTVTDTVTGLMWQQTDGGEMAHPNAILYCNELSLGGYSDWRLPTAQELFTILNHQHTNPAHDNTYFTATAAEYWWSSNDQSNDPNKAWATNAGGGIGNHPKSETISAGGTKRFHVRAVRDKTPPLSLPSHFTDNQNGTITDNNTQLMWQKNPFADSITWENALHYADTLSVGGFTDWRLPNIKELHSINDETRVNPSVSPTFFPTIGLKKYWSSTSLPNQITKAWYLQTQFGITTYALKTAKNNLICVRANPAILTATENLSGERTKRSVFPNPFLHHISIQEKRREDIFILTNIRGQIIYSGQDIEKQDFSFLEAGIYILKMTGIEGMVMKLVKL
jgi:hypothetical protein